MNLTVPLATLLGLAERPGLLSRTGPVDPALARDLAAAAARSPRSTWCLTVTGPDHRPVAHGCGRPPPRRDGRDAAARAARDGPLFTPGDDHGPPGTGTIRLDIAALTGTAGPAGTTIAVGGLVFALENLAGPCDHRHQANGHDPGVRLRHLTGILNACCTFPPCRRPGASVTTSTAPRTSRAAGPACARPGPSAGTTTATSRPPAGGWNTPAPAAGSAGEPPPAAPTSAAPPNTPTDAPRLTVVETDFGAIPAPPRCKSRRVRAGPPAAGRAACGGPGRLRRDEAIRWGGAARD